MTPWLNRRAAALALAALFAPVTGARPPAPARIAAPQGSDPFSLGVASGMPRPGSLVIWTRLAPRPHEPDGGLPDAPIELHWQLAEDEQFTRALRQGRVLAHPQHAHSVRVPVDGLRSGAQHFYRFRVGDAWSPVGRARTAPAADAEVAALRLALASCQHYEQGAYAAHRDIAGRDLDFVLFVGDYIYESSNPRYRIRPHEGPVPTTLAGYRARHATYKLDADLRAAHAAHAWVLTWDDHEVENDYADAHSLKAVGAEAFLRRRAAAYQAYFEHLPLAPSRAPDGASMRIHDRFTWGQLAELWALDGRQHRSLQACASEGQAGGRLLWQCDELADPARTVFGAAQEAWLADGLGRSTRRWKLLAQASQLSPAGVDTPIGRRIYSDGWDGYPRARERLLDAMARAPGGNVLSLGGDVHRHVAATLRLRPDDPRTAVVGSEFVCTSVSTRGLSDTVAALLRASNPDVLHLRGDERGYALVEVSPERARCSFLGTPHPAAPGAALRVQAVAEVEAGRAGPHLG
jgi:alkaline phosphatase D